MPVQHGRLRRGGAEAGLRFREDLHRPPADLALRVLHHFSAEHIGDQLRAEAHAEHAFTGGHRRRDGRLFLR